MGALAVILFIAGIILLAYAVKSKTAFIALLLLSAVMSFFLVINPGDFAGIMLLTISLSLGILLLDNAGYLA